MSSIPDWAQDEEVSSLSEPDDSTPDWAQDDVTELVEPVEQVAEPIVAAEEEDQSTPWGLMKKGFYQSQAGGEIQEAARVAEEVDVIGQQGAPIKPAQLKPFEQSEIQKKIDELKSSDLLTKIKKPAGNLIEHTIKKYGDTLTGPGMTAGMITKIALEDKDVALDVADSVLNKHADEAIDNLKKASEIPDSKAMEKVMQAGDLGEAFSAFLDNPIDVSVDAMSSSAYPMAEVIVTGAVGAPLGPAGFVAGTFKGSFDTNYKSKFMEVLTGEGADLSTREGIKKALADKGLIRKANKDAFNYSLPIAVFDAASGGLASKTMASTPLKSTLAQTATQTGLGGGGEALGQISETGEITSPGEVLIEGLMEAPGGIIEPAIIGKRKLFGKGEDSLGGTDQGGSPPELFNPTHKGGGGQDVQIVTKDGKVVPDTYMDAQGNILRDSNAVPNSPDSNDISMDVNATVGAVKAEIEAKRGGIVGGEMGPAQPDISPTIPAAEAQDVISGLEAGLEQPIQEAAEAPIAVPVEEVAAAQQVPEEITVPTEPKKLKPMVERKAETEAIKTEIKTITDAGAARQKEYLAKDPRAPVEGAEPLTFQTDEEKARLHELKQQLPSRGQEVADAKERIEKRLEARKSAGKEVTAAAHEAATSPKNDLEVPTEAQKEAGNYKKGHVSVQGLDIAIENPAGSKRRPEWPTLKQHYGYIKRTVGADSELGAIGNKVEQVDVFVKPNVDVSVDNPIFIIDQATEDGTGFDEHKVMMGFASEEEASEAYLANYTKGWKGLKAITQATPEEFKTWLNEGDTRADYATGETKAIVPREAEVKATGKVSNVKTSKGSQIKTKFAVVEGDTLIASNDDAGNKNPDYPVELQPRDRTRGASMLQIKKISNNLDPTLLEDSAKASDGAPIIGPDSVVESGNARVLGIRGAYIAKKAKAYRQHLIDNAESYGLTADEIASIKEPVLVRVRQDEMDTKARAEFARQANQPDIAPMSPMEQAKSDSDRITDEDMKLYNPSDNGNILAASNQGFLQAFAKKLGDLEVGGLSTSDGRWTKQMGDRVQAAIFNKAYGDERLLNLVAEEADPDIKNILNALNKAAPAFARARAIKADLGNLDIISDIVSAIDVIRKAKAKGTSVQQEVSQTGLFGNVDPVVSVLSEFIESGARSSRRLGIGFTEMATFLESELLSEHQDALFDMGAIGKAEIVSAANRRITEVYGNEKGITDLFAQSEAAARTDERDDQPRARGREPGKGAGEKIEVAEPVKVFHGTKQTFGSIDISKSELGSQFFTVNKEHASRFGEVREFEVDIKNPLVITQVDLENKVTAEDVKNDVLPQEYVQSFIDEAKTKGHDGLIIKGFADMEFSADVYLPFNNKQIKETKIAVEKVLPKPELAAKDAPKTKHKIVEEVNTLKDKQKGWGIKDHYKFAHANQVQLNELGELISEKSTAEYKHASGKHSDSAAGEKSKESAKRKVETKYSGDASNLTDIVRGTFIVRNPGQVTDILEGLSDKLIAVDEGWAITPTGYFDRKVLIQFDNGQIGELQIVTPNMLYAKEVLGMHDIYGDWRKTLVADPETGKLKSKAGLGFLVDVQTNTMAKTYAEAVRDETNQEWREVFKGVAQESLDTQVSSSLIGIALAPSTTKSRFSSVQAPSRKTAAAPRPFESTKSTAGAYSYENEAFTVPNGKSIVSSYIESLPQTAIRGTQKLDLRSGVDDIQTGDFVSYDDIRKAPPKKGLTTESLNSIVKNLQRDYHGVRDLTFHVRATQDEAFGPGSTKRDGSIKGGFYAGTNEVVLIAENIKDLNDAFKVVRHEVVGHFGLRQLLNRDGEYDVLLERVYESRNGELKDLYDWVAKAYPDLVANNDVRKIADEMLARAAETKTKSNLLTQIYDQIIRLLNKIGLIMDTINYSEVNALIRLSERNLRKDIRPSEGAYDHLVMGSRKVAEDFVSIEGQFELFSPKGVPVGVAKKQSADNFNINYKQVEVGKLNVGTTSVNNAEEAAHVLAPIRKHGQETMMAVVLDKDKNVLHVIRHSKGMKSGASVSPVELAAAIGATDNAKSVWFGHNHPSGISMPSSSDLRITKELNVALEGSGVKIEGHIVVGKGVKAWAIDPTGSGENSYEIKTKAFPRGKAVSVTERMIRKNKISGAPQLNSPARTKEFIRDNEIKNGVILLNTQHQVIGVLGMSLEEMSALRKNKQIPRILKAIDATNAAATIIVTSNKKASKNLGAYLARLGDLKLLDSFIREKGVFYSMSERGETIGDRGKPFYSKVEPGQTFDTSDPNVLFSRHADNTNDAPVGSSLGMPEENFRQFTARLFHDAFNRVKTLQETIQKKGGTVETKSDVYRAEERSSSKISYGLKQMSKKYMEPMLKLMKKNNIDIDTLDKFLIAKHAQERNKYIASINDDMPDGGSGITNQEAKDILNELKGQLEVLGEIAEFVYKANDNALDTLVKGGHLKQDVVDGWKARWNYYVPLKGKDGEELRAGTGTGFSIGGAGVKKAMGRGAGNVAESPTAHSFAQAETAIVRTEKSKVGQALIELVRANPDPGFWSISQRTYKQFETLFGEPFEGYEDVPEGLIENLDYHRVSAITTEERTLAEAEGRKPVAKIVFKLDPNYKRRDDIFSVMVEGEELLIQIKDKVLMEQLKKMNTTQLNAVVAGFGTLNRYLAMINTALNPEFVITNFERDFQTAMINLGGEHSAAIAAKEMKAIPGAIRGIWQSTFDTKGTSEWRTLFEEMEEEGGTIGFFGLEDVETKVNNIQRKLTDNHGVLGRTKQGVLAVRDVVLDANLSVENAARLASYKVIKEEAIANGMSEVDAKAKAASVAKNLTVNFNRKGELAPVLNSAYLFYNASIQGSMRILTALKNKRVRKIVGGVMATSFALAMYNRSSGDDDDGIPYWDKISDYTKQTNLIVMHPDGSGNYSKIRLPYGYNVFFYAGVAMQDLVFNEKASVAKTTMNMLSATMNAFNPIQGADLLDTLTPTFLKPYEQDARNINFMGTPLKPEFPFDTYDRPESQKHFKSTNPQLVEMMAAINEATGGDETHSGLIDVSPEIIKHYVSWLTGGAGMFGVRTLGVATSLATGEEIDMKNIPFVRTLGGKPGSHYDTDRFYKAIKEVAATEAQLKLYKGTDEYGAYKADNLEVHKLAIHVRRYKNKIKRLREKRDKAYINDDRDLANEIREEIRQNMMEFSVRYDDAIEAQE